MNEKRIPTGRKPRAKGGCLQRTVRWPHAEAQRRRGGRRQPLKRAEGSGAAVASRKDAKAQRKRQEKKREGPEGRKSGRCMVPKFSANPLLPTAVSFPSSLPLLLSPLRLRARPLCVSAPLRETLLVFSSPPFPLRLCVFARGHCRPASLAACAPLPKTQPGATRCSHRSRRKTAYRFAYFCRPSSSRCARSIQAMFSWFSIRPVRKSAVPASPCFSSASSRSSRSSRTMCS